MAARYLRDTRKALIAHVGGNPSVVERILIDRVAQLGLRLRIMDAKLAESSVAITGHDTDHYLAWHSAMVRTLRALGLKGDDFEEAIGLADHVRRMEPRAA